MQPPGGDADLGTEPELAPIGELGRSVMQNDGRIDFAQEPLRGLAVVGDDCVGVARSVALDMSHCGREIIHDLHSNDRIKILGGPILLGGWLRTFVYGHRRRVAADLAAGVNQHGNEGFQVGSHAGAIDKQGLRRAAHARPPHFGVQDNSLGHLERGRAMDENVTNALKVREYRHARFRLDASHQALSATGHNDIDVSIQTLQHQANCRPVPGRDKLYRCVWQAGRLQSLGEGRQDGPAGANTV
jgi:hypothetical protein